MLYSKNKINAKKVYSKYKLTGKGVRIVLLDTGVYPRDEVKRKIVLFKDYVNGMPFPYDDNGHGTHIAGILCADKKYNDFSGIAPDAQLIVLKVLDSRGNGKTADTINALKWIIDNYELYNIKLVNFSIGYTLNSNISEQERLLEYIEKIWDLGIIVVVAAGNNGPNSNTVTVPGISKKVITVGAMENAKFSGKGPTDACVIKPEILAPGVNIYSLRNESDGIARRNGTSMATPIVCGALALALEKNPKLTPAQLKLLLYQTVREIPEKRRECWGILDVDELIKNI